MQDKQGKGRLPAQNPRVLVAPCYKRRARSPRPREKWSHSPQGRTESGLQNPNGIFHNSGTFQHLQQAGDRQPDDIIQIALEAFDNHLSVFLDGVSPGLIVHMHQLHVAPDS